MIDGERRSCRLEMCDGTQGHFTASCRVNIYIVQADRALPKLRRCFHHNVILVERCVHRRNLRLTKRLVKRVVDQLRCDSEARCRVAIVNERRLKPAILLIGIDVGEAG